MTRIRIVVFAGLFAILAGIPLACQQPMILSTISCAVYQPPETPRPDWPKQCGGTR